MKKNKNQNNVQQQNMMQNPMNPQGNNFVNPQYMQQPNPMQVNGQDPMQAFAQNQQPNQFTQQNNAFNQNPIMSQQQNYANQNLNQQPNPLAQNNMQMQNANVFPNQVQQPMSPDLSNAPALVPATPQNNPNNVPSLYQAQEIAPYTGFTNLPTLQQPLLPGVYNPGYGMPAPYNPMGMTNKKSKKNLIIGFTVGGSLALAAAGAGIGVWTYQANNKDKNKTIAKEALIDQINAAKVYLDKAVGKEKFNFMDRDLKLKLNEKIEEAENYSTASYTDEKGFIEKTEILLKTLNEVKKEHEYREETRNDMQFKVEKAKEILDKAASDPKYTEVYRLLKTDYYNALASNSNIEEKWENFKNNYDLISSKSNEAEKQLKSIDQEINSLKSVKRTIDNTNLKINSFPSEINSEKIKGSLDSKITSKYDIETTFYADDVTGRLTIIDKFYKVVAGIRILFGTVRTFSDNGFKTISSQFDKYNQNLKVEPKNHPELNKDIEQIWNEKIKDNLDREAYIRDLINKFINFGIKDKNSENYIDDSIKVEYAGVSSVNNPNRLKALEFDQNSKTFTVNYRFSKIVKEATDDNPNKTTVVYSKWYSIKGIDFKQIIETNKNLTDITSIYNSLRKYITDKMTIYRETYKMNIEYKKPYDDLDQKISQVLNDIDTYKNNNNLDNLKLLWGDPSNNKAAEIDTKYFDPYFTKFESYQKSRKAFTDAWITLLAKKAEVEFNRGKQTGKYLAAIWENAIDGLKPIYDAWNNKAFDKGDLKSPRYIDENELQDLTAQITSRVKTYEAKVNELKEYEEKVANLVTELNIEHNTYITPEKLGNYKTFMTLGTNSTQWGTLNSSSSNEIYFSRDLIAYQEIHRDYVNIVDALLKEAEGYQNSSEEKTPSRNQTFYDSLNARLEEAKRLKAAKVQAIQDIFTDILNWKKEFFNTNNKFCIEDYKIINSSELDNYKDYIVCSRYRDDDKNINKVEIVKAVAGYENYIKEFKTFLDNAAEKMFYNYKDQQKSSFYESRTLAYFNAIHEELNNAYTQLSTSKTVDEREQYEKLYNEYQFLENNLIAISDSNKLLHKEITEALNVKQTMDNLSIKEYISKTNNGNYHKNNVRTKFFYEKIKELVSRLEKAIIGEDSFKQSLESYKNKIENDNIQKFKSLLTDAGFLNSEWSHVTIENYNDSKYTSTTGQHKLYFNELIAKFQDRLTKMLQAYKVVEDDYKTKGYEQAKITMNDQIFSNSAVFDLTPLDKELSEIKDIYSKIENSLKILKEIPTKKQNSYNGSKDQWKKKKFESIFKEYEAKVKTIEEETIKKLITSLGHISDSENTNSLYGVLKNIETLTSSLNNTIKERDEAFQAFELLVDEVNSLIERNYTASVYDDIVKSETLTDKVDHNSNTDDFPKGIKAKLEGAKDSEGNVVASGFLEMIYNDVLNKQKGRYVSSNDQKGYGKWYFERLTHFFNIFKIKASIIHGSQSLNWDEIWEKEFMKMNLEWSKDAPSQKDDFINNDSLQIPSTFLNVTGYDKDLYDVSIDSVSRQGKKLLATISIRTKTGIQYSQGILEVQIAQKLSGTNYQTDWDQEFITQAKNITKWEATPEFSSQLNTAINESTGKIEPKWLTLSGYDKDYFGYEITNVERTDENTATITVKLWNQHGNGNKGTKTKEVKLKCALKTANGSTANSVSFIS